MAQDIDEARTQRYIEVQQSAEFGELASFLLKFIAVLTTKLHLQRKGLRRNVLF